MASATCCFLVSVPPLLNIAENNPSSDHRLIKSANKLANLSIASPVNAIENDSFTFSKVSLNLSWADWDSNALRDAAPNWVVSSS